MNKLWTHFILILFISRPASLQLSQWRSLLRHAPLPLCLQVRVTILTFNNAMCCQVRVGGAPVWHAHMWAPLCPWRGLCQAGCVRMSARLHRCVIMSWVSWCSNVPHNALMFLMMVTGSRCEEAACHPPCQHGGQCTEPFTCSCPSGYSGRFCQKCEFHLKEKHTNPSNVELGIGGL